MENAAYLTACECLVNVAKHAAVDSARVNLHRSGETYLMEVSDDGAGLIDIGRGSGLAGLHDRLAAVGASLRIGSHPSSGSRVAAVFAVGDVS